MRSGRDQFVRFTAVLGFGEDLQVPRDMQAAHGLTAQRNDVVDVVLNAGQFSQPCGLNIHGLDCSQVDPFRKRLPLSSLAAPCFSSYQGAIGALIGAVLFSIRFHPSHFLVAVRCLIQARLRSYFFFSRSVIRLLLRNVLISFGVVVGFAAGACFLWMRESPSFAGRTQCLTMCGSVGGLFCQLFLMCQGRNPWNS